MKTLKRTLLLIIPFFGLVHAAAAQAETGVAEVADNIPQFFICLVAGVLLAIGFQALLTTLSVASGVSLIGNIEDKANHAREDADRDTHDTHSKENQTPVLVKISSAAGIWSVLTVSISLFFASLLAVKLSLIGNDILGVTLGLVIWAAFFTAMMYLEIKSVSSLIGFLFNTALQGFRNSVDMMKGLFQQSQKSKAEDIAAATVDELAHSIDTSQITRKMDEYMERLEPQPLDYDKIKKDIAEMLNDIALEETSEVDDSGVKKRTFIQVASRQPRFSRHDVQKLGHVFDEAKKIASSGGSRADRVIHAVDRFTPGSEEDTKRYRSKLEAYLRNTGREELNPDRLKRDLEEMMNEPSRSKEIALNRFNQMDRSTLVSVLSQREDISREQADQIAGYAEEALNFVKEKILGQPSREHNFEGDSQTDINIQKKGSKMTDFETRVSNYFNSLERPEFNYERIKRDFEQIFQDPRSAGPVLRNRLKQYDRDSLIALLSSSDKISKEQAERMAEKVEEAKQTILAKADELQMEARAKVEQARTLALHEAENMRKAAVAAAWWLFATALVSGAASALGGILALS